MDKNFKKALNYAFLLLKYRMRSRGEIIWRLRRKKTASEVIERVIAYLEKYHYIDDREFASAFVSSHKAQGWGPRKIRFALRKLCVDETVIEVSLGPSEEYRKKIQELIRKRLVRKKEKNSYPRIVQYLKMRGFDYADIIAELKVADRQYFPRT